MNTEIERNETVFIRKKVQGKKTQGRIRVQYVDMDPILQNHILILITEPMVLAWSSRNFVHLQSFHVLDHSFSFEE
jgi:hypothetical protein